MLTIEHDPDGYLVCRAAVRLTRADYEAAIPVLVNAIRIATAPLRIMVVLEGFQGWDIDALWQELRFDLRHRDDLGRVAILGESKLEEWLSRLSKPFFDAEIRYFDSADRTAARDWLLAGNTPST